MKDSFPHFSTVGVVVDFRLSAELVLIGIRPMQDNLKRQSALASHLEHRTHSCSPKLWICNGNSSFYFSDIFPGEIVAPQSFKVKHSISGMYKLISLAGLCVQCGTN